jgi:RNA polymerase sigma factor (sigma-70 family)
VTTPLRYPDLVTALKDVQGNPHDRRASRSWEVIVTAIEHAARLLRLHDRAGEVVSATFLRVRESPAVFNGKTEAEARSYLYRLAKTSFIDELRKQKRHDKRAQLRSVHDDRDPLDLVAAPEPEPSASRTAQQERRALAEFKDRLHGRIDAHIEQLPLRDADQRELRWSEAMAALLTIIDKKGAKEIARELGEPEDAASKIHKWKQRGQALVLSVIEAWSADADPQDEQAIESLRELFSERRVDAGVARLERRKGSKTRGEPPSQRGFVSPRERYASVQRSGRRSTRPGPHPYIRRGGRRARREVPSD